MIQVVEHGLGHLPFTEKQVITPTGKRSVSINLDLIKTEESAASRFRFSLLKSHQSFKKILQDIIPFVWIPGLVSLHIKLLAVVLHLLSGNRLFVCRWFWEEIVIEFLAFLFFLVFINM